MLHRSSYSGPIFPAFFFNTLKEYVDTYLGSLDRHYHISVLYQVWRGNFSPDDCM